MTVIQPTHSCFDDAMDFFEVFDLSDGGVVTEMLRTLRLVHGVCVSSEGIAYAHAWVEEHVSAEPERKDWPTYVVWQGMVHEGRRGYFAVARQWFYGAYKVKSQTSYTMHQFAELNAKTGHYGPWRQKYRELVEAGRGRRLGVVQGAKPLGFCMPRQRRLRRCHVDE